jgi:hypothetical protein
MATTVNTMDAARTIIAPRDIVEVIGTVAAALIGTISMEIEATEADTEAIAAGEGVAVVEVAVSHSIEASMMLAEVMDNPVMTTTQTPFTERSSTFSPSMIGSFRCFSVALTRSQHDLLWSQGTELSLAMPCTHSHGTIS